MTENNSYYLTQIEWDTDGEEALPLPKTARLELHPDTVDIEEALGDLLAERFGYCVYGFNYEKI